MSHSIAIFLVGVGTQISVFALHVDPTFNPRQIESTPDGSAAKSRHSLARNILTRKVTASSSLSSLCNEFFDSRAICL